MGNARVTPRSRRNNGERLETREGTFRFATQSGRAAPISESQRAVLAHIGRALRDQNVPPLDRGLRSIVAQQVGNLLRGGWPVDEIEHVAVELALTYDRFHGHEPMLGLQRVVELADERRQEKQHADRKQAAESIDPRVAAVLAGHRAPRRAHANDHPFVAGPERDACAYAPDGILCGGPVGVHVRKLTERMAEVRREMVGERAARRSEQARCPECDVWARPGHDCPGCGTFLTTGPRDDERHAVAAAYRIMRAADAARPIRSIGDVAGAELPF